MAMAVKGGLRFGSQTEKGPLLLIALPYSSIHSYRETSGTLKLTEQVILYRKTHTYRKEFA